MTRTMTLTVAEDLPPIRLRRNARARRLSLRVSQADGRATLTVPVWVGDREIRQFLANHADWLRDALPDPDAGRQWRDRLELPYRGAVHAIVHAGGTGRAARKDGQAIYVPGPAPMLGARLSAFLKAQARAELVAAADRYAAALGRDYNRLTLRDTRSRWGSCSSQGNLMFSWRLIMAPPKVLDYVAAHEVAHLAHMDHSQRFWRQVEALMPDYRAHRDWLREHGAKLQRIRFD